MTPYQFFHKHAGYSWTPGKETKAQGRARCAKALAAAEKAARESGAWFDWSIDPCASSADWIERGKDGGPGRKPWQVWQCAMYDESGACVASLHSIDFGRDGEPYGDPYRRVVEAELASEAGV